MIKVFVSGFFDIVHAGHLQFFREARALGDHLTVSFASAEVLWRQRQRRSSLPDEHKRALIASLGSVDDVVVGAGLDEGLEFKEHFLSLRPHILAVTEDDRYTAAKQALCAQVGARYVVLPKTPPQFPPISTTEIVRWIRAPQEAPLRVDFAGGWLDVPRFARPGGYVVNCAISPTVSLRSWPYERNAGLGGSGAWALLNGKDGVDSELDLGVGWQDPAVIAESGLCVWRSGRRPDLELKTDGAFLRGRMAVFWTGTPHSTPGVANQSRDYDAIERAGRKWNIRVNAISAGRLKSRAAKAIGMIDDMIAYSKANAPLVKDLAAEEVANAALFLSSPLASAITGEVLFVDNGLHAMGMSVDSESINQNKSATSSAAAPSA